MKTEEILAAIREAAETIATPNCAAWLSALAALGAVTVAVVVAVMQIRIAKKQNEIAEEQTKISKKQAEISDEQNKIALLEKRVEVYNLALCCKVIAKDILESAKDNRAACKIFQTGIIKFPFISASLAINQTHIGEMEIKIILEKLSQAEFLFSREVSKPIVALVCRFLFLMQSYNEEDFSIQKDLLSQLMTITEQDNIFEKMKDELLLKPEVDVCFSPNPPTNPPSSSYSPTWATPTSTPPT